MFVTPIWEYKMG